MKISDFRKKKRHKYFSFSTVSGEVYRVIDVKPHDLACQNQSKNIKNFLILSVLLKLNRFKTPQTWIILCNFNDV